MSDSEHISLPGHACQVLSAADLFVSLGVNAGDELGGPDEVCPGDIYQLDPDHAPLRLVVTRPEGGGQRVGAGSAAGHPGEPIQLEARYALMASDGDQVELLLLSRMAARTDYTLLKVEEAPEDTGLSDLLCVSFARGTMITLATGVQRPIEALASGDAVLTRDHGAQPIRWIGHTPLRAVGVFAPVVITARRVV